MPHIDRLRALGLNVTQAAWWLEIPPKALFKALDERELPFWAQYCIDGMEAEFADDPAIFASCNIDADLAGDTWSAKTARAALPVLLERAENGHGPITYTELDDELMRRDPNRKPAGQKQKYAFPLGRIGRTIDAIRKVASDPTSSVDGRYSHLPPLEGLVVNGRTGMPGGGIDQFLKNYLNDIGEPDGETQLIQDRKGVVERIHGDIELWNDWKILRDVLRS